MDLKSKKELHRKFLKRELSQAELKEYFSLLENAEPDDLEEVESISELYPVSWDPSNGKAKQMIRREVKMRMLRLTTLRGMAAVLALIVAVGGIISYNQYSDYKKTQTYKCVTVGVGKVMDLKLQDGSVVTLESGSILKYPELFGKQERRVYLVEGRAFFKVARNKSWPFRVHSGKLRTTVLGTSFVIQHYREYGFEKVSLYTGKVKIDREGNTGNSVFMTPGQQYEFDNQKTKTGVLSSFKVVSNPMDGGQLQFHNTEFSEAIYRIASYYKIKIQFDERSFAKDFVSGNIKSSSVEELLNSLSFINHFKIIKINHLEYKIMKNQTK